MTPTGLVVAHEQQQLKSDSAPAVELRRIQNTTSESKSDQHVTVALRELSTADALCTRGFLGPYGPQTSLAQRDSTQLTDSYVVLLSDFSPSARARRRTRAREAIEVEHMSV